MTYKTIHVNKNNKWYWIKDFYVTDDSTMLTNKKTEAYLFNDSSLKYIKNRKILDEFFEYQIENLDGTVSETNKKEEQIDPFTEDALLKAQEWKKTNNKQRKYLPTLAEIVDRLSILSLKELRIPENKAEYAKEIQDVLHDIDLMLEEQNPKLDANFIRNVIVLAQMNTWIWVNESNFRKGIKDGNNLELTHGLNSIRNLSKNKIQELVGGRKDYKLDSVRAFPEWIPSGYEKEYDKTS